VAVADEPGGHGATDRTASKHHVTHGAKRYNT
jgi:hypothetical protein